ncbi:MAG: FAD-binding protein, partial [Acidimicrobiales bacterium]
GGVRVDPESQAATVPGLFAAGEVAGGMHGANRLGGNSLSDLLVFGRRAGMGASDFAEAREGEATVEAAQVDAVVTDALAPFGRDGGESPYALHEELQQTMQTLVGIIRTGAELEEALAKLGELRDRTAKLTVSGGRAYNPGWNLATDLPSLLTVSTAVTQGALARRESRGAHTRDDYPDPDLDLAKVNFVQRQTDQRGLAAPIHLGPEPLPEMPPELRELLEEGH